MKARILFIIVIIVVCMVGGILIYQKVTEKKMVVQKIDIYNEKMKYQGVKIILYNKGEQKSLDNHSSYFPKVLYECERLLKTAEDGYKLYVEEDLLERIKKEQIALEIIYHEIINIPVWRKPFLIGKLLIPLKGEFSEGVIFFEIKVKDSPYSHYGNALNMQGVGKLKKILKKMEIKID